MNSFARLSLFVSLVLASPLIHADLPIIGHQLSVRLDPQDEHLEARDRLELPAGRADWILLMHEGFQLRVVEGKARLEPLGHLEHLARYRLHPLSPGPVTLAYSGRIAHGLLSMDDGMGRERQWSLGFIGPEGVVLSGASGWYPRIPDSLQRFTLEVEHPRGWSAVSQGAGPGDAVDAGRSRWVETLPQDDLYLIAAPFHREMRTEAGVEAQLYLRTPDAALAERYLAATHASIRDYSQLIGPYPFAKFALVENLWESGYGMPSFTLLGPRVIRLPFILETSYPHEILHNWWGNGVYVDYAQGNWSEGLTTYLADYRASERAGRGAAHRRDMLRRYADYVSTGADFPLKDFRARHGAPSQSVGYDKGAMVFHMLRRRLGDATFIAGLRRFYADWQFRVAGFAELRQSFEQVSGEDLGDFFNAWIERPGAPRLALREPRLEGTEDGYRLSLRLDQVQNEPPFPIEIPLVIHDAAGAAQRLWIPSRERSMVLDIGLESPPLRLALDPAWDVFRHLEPGETPLVLSALFGAERGLLVLPAEATPEEGAAYRQLAEQWRRGRPGWDIRLDRDLEQLPEDRPIWLLGWNNRQRMAVLEGAEDFSLDDKRLRLRDGDSGQWIESSLDATTSLVLSRLRNGQALAWLGARTSAALPALARKLPHYGNSSYLLFEGAEAHNRLKGQWPSAESALVHWFGPRQPLAPLPEPVLGSEPEQTDAAIRSPEPPI